MNKQKRGGKKQTAEGADGDQVFRTREAIEFYGLNENDEAEIANSRSGTKKQKNAAEELGVMNDDPWAFDKDVYVPPAKRKKERK